MPISRTTAFQRRNFLLKKILFCAIILSGNILPALAQTAKTTSYLLGSNLYLRINGVYQEGTGPKWSIYHPEGDGTGKTQILMKVTPGLPEYRGLSETYGAPYLTNDNGKLKLIFSGFGFPCTVAFDVKVPAGPVFLSGTPQTFALTNYRTTDPACLPQYPAGKVVYDNLTGTVTLSANAAGDITIQLTIKMEKDGKLKSTITSENDRYNNSQSPERLENLASGSKYLSLLEAYAMVHYEGWLHDKQYVKGSMKEANVIRRDAKGQPAVISGSFKRNTGWSGGIYLLMNEGVVYGVVFTSDPTTVITPFKKMGEENIPFSPAELKIINQLQHRYLYNLMLELQNDKYEKEWFALDNLVIAPHYVSEQRSRMVSGKEYYYASDGSLKWHDYEKSETYYVSVPVPGIKNAGKQTLVVRGINVTRDLHGLTYENGSLVLQPGETAVQTRIRPAFDMNNPQSCYFGNINSTLRATLDKNVPIRQTAAAPVTAKLPESPKAEPMAVRKGNILEVNSLARKTDIKVKKGDAITIIAKGAVKLGDFAGSGGPDGISGYKGYCLVSTAPHGSLVARTGGGEWRFAGSKTVFTADDSGVLQLLVNDSEPGNNTGAFEVTVWVNGKQINEL